MQERDTHTLILSHSTQLLELILRSNLINGLIKLRIKHYDNSTFIIFELVKLITYILDLCNASEFFRRFISREQRIDISILSSVYLIQDSIRHLCLCRRLNSIICLSIGSIFPTKTDLTNYRFSYRN